MIQHRTTKKDRQCACGHLLRGEQEQGQGRCIECGIQDAVNEEIMATLSRRADTQDQSLQPVAHIVRKALSAEQEALIRFSQAMNAGDEPHFLYAHHLSEALTFAAKAFERWAYVGSRLWYMRQVLPNGNDPSYLLLLHTWSIKQFDRLLIAHLAMQADLLAFCQEHKILLTCSIIDQSIDLSAHPSEERQPGSTGKDDTRSIHS